VADPALDLDQAKRLMGALYEPGDTFYVLAYEDKKKGGRRERRFAFDDAWSVGPFIAATDQRRWAVATSVGVFAEVQPCGHGPSWAVEYGRCALRRHLQLHRRPPVKSAQMARQRWSGWNAVAASAFGALAVAYSLMQNMAVGGGVAGCCAASLLALSRAEEA